MYALMSKLSEVIDSDTIIGKSLIKKNITVETNPSIISQNNNTILYHICQPKKSTMNYQLNKNSTSISIKSSPT